jgi:recombination protein RecR
MDSLRKLEQIFSSFPGIGPRQAKRFVHFILSRPNSFSQELVSLLSELKKSAKQCNSCQRIFIDASQKISNSGLCNVCSNTNRDSSKLMVVSTESDFESIEKSAVYDGLYFIVGGVVPILDKEPDKRIRLFKLLEHINANQSIVEVILSMSTTPDGEHTCTIIKESIQKVLENTHRNMKISILGRGLSTGAEIEYADPETLRSALENRK